MAIDLEKLREWAIKRIEFGHQFDSDFAKGLIAGLNELLEKIQSGAFDADESEPEPDDYESMVLLDVYGQIQRLRAALEDVRYQVQQSDHPAGLGILATINQALSTTIEPTNAAKVEQFECPCCGCEISIKPNPELPKGEESE